MKLSTDTIPPHVNLSSAARRPTNVVPVEYLAEFSEVMYHLDFSYGVLAEGVGGRVELIEVRLQAGAITLHRHQCYLSSLIFLVSFLILFLLFLRFLTHFSVFLVLMTLYSPGLS